MAPSIGPHIGLCIRPFFGGGWGLEEAKEGRVKVGGSLADLMTENGTIRPFWRFLFLLCFSRQNWTFTLQNVVFLECGKSLCSEVPKPHNSRNAYKTREIQQDHTWPCRRHWLQNWPDMTAKRGKKTEGQMLPFSRGHRGGAWGKKNKSRGEGEGERGKGRAGGRGKGRG